MSATVDGAEVLLSNPGSVFDGITYAQARALNDAIGWRRVEVIGGKFRESKHRPTEYVFHRVLLPGHARSDPFSCVGDLELWNWDAERERCVSGSKRVLSMSLVRSFKVIEAPELSCCHACGTVLPQSQLTDAGPAFYTGVPGEYESRLECKPCWLAEW